MINLGCLIDGEDYNRLFPLGSSESKAKQLNMKTEFIELSGKINNGLPKKIFLLLLLLLLSLMVLPPKR